MDTRKAIDKELKKAATVYAARGPNLKADECAIIIKSMSEAADLDPTYKSADVAKVLQHAYFYSAKHYLKKGDITTGQEYIDKYYLTNPPEKFRAQIETILQDAQENRIKAAYDIINTYKTTSITTNLLAIQKFFKHYPRSDNEVVLSIVRIEEKLIKNLKLSYQLIINDMNERDLDGALVKAKNFYSQFPKNYSKAHETYHAQCYNYYTAVKDLLLQINVKRSRLASIPAYKAYHSQHDYKPKPRDVKPVSVIKSMTNTTFGKVKLPSASVHVVKSKTKK